MTKKIGQDAGLVWAALESKGCLDVKALKKETKLKEKELLLAFGWLAREGKLIFSEDEKELCIKLA
ncbi:MAG: winged helix-turn-helix domain-containing protein [Prevotellaceae bacterium]|nr:winged helix-turn-helix domain-containing protein [Prevotellaceae bacterium]